MHTPTKFVVATMGGAAAQVAVSPEPYKSIVCIHFFLVPSRAGLSLLSPRYSTRHILTAGQARDKLLSLGDYSLAAYNYTYSRT